MHDDDQTTTGASGVSPEQEDKLAEVAGAAEPPVRWGEIFRRLGGLGVLALLAATLPAIAGFLLLSYRQEVADWLLTHPDRAVVIYTTAFALLAGLAVLPTYAQAIIGGFVFHFQVGFPAALGGFVGGALIGYAIARAVGGDRAAAIIAEHRKWQVVRDALVGGGFWKTLAVVFLVRVPPNSPFALTNLVLAAIRVPPVQYALGTLLGMAPRTALAVYAGSQLKGLTDVGMPKWMFWVGVVVTLAVLGVLGAIIQRAVHRATAGLSRAGRRGGEV